MQKLRLFKIVTIFSVIGMLIWNITDYYGGMIIHLFQYWYLIIPTIIIYVLSFLITIYKVAKSGINSNKIIIGVHLFFIIFILTCNIIDSDFFKSKKVLTATLKDDLAHYTLILREDGTCENNLSGFLGYEEKFKGQYLLKGDTIIFKVKPYNNDFLPDTLLIDKTQKVIFTQKDKSGKFNTKKEWLNHFEIQ